MSTSRYAAHLTSVRHWLTTFFGGSSARVFRGMATLALGTGFGRAISVASMPVLTRLYGPDDFGVLAVFTALVSILAPLVTLRYVLAVPLPRRDGTAMNLVVLCLALMMGLTAILGVALWLTHEPLFAVFSMEILAPWWWLLVIGVVAASTYELLTHWALRQRDYKIIATTNVWQNAAGSFVKIALGLLSLKPAGLLIGQVLTYGGGITALLRRFVRALQLNWRRVNQNRLRKVAWRHRAFAFYRVPSHFLLVFSVHAPILFVAMLFDSNTTGQLGLAIMAVTLPVTLFGRTTAKAFYAEASRIGPRQPEAIRAVLIDVLKKLTLIAVFPSFFLILFGVDIFILTFGSEWGLAGLFSSSLAIFLFFQFLQTPAAHVFYIFDGQRALLFLNVQRIVIVIFVFAISYAVSLSAAVTIFVYSIALALHYALSIAYAVAFIPREYDA